MIGIVGRVGRGRFSRNLGVAQDRRHAIGAAYARWRAINLTAKSRKSRWSRPVGSSATLANKASPDIAACMWAALKRAMAYCVSDFRGAARVAFLAASIRTR